MIGTFSTGTGVGLGDTVLNDLSPGFENNGKFLRFTAPDQLIAMRGARLLSPDGSDKPIVLESDTSGPSYYNAKTKKVFVPFEFPTYGIYPLIDNATPKQFSNDKDGITIDDLNALEAADLQWHLTFVRPDGSICNLPGPRPGGRDRTAIVTPYSDSLAEIKVPLWQCLEVGPPGRPSRPLVVLDGKAFGLSDAPFKSISDQELTFLAPNALLQGQTTLNLKRLFLGKAYETTYRLPPANAVSVTGISILQSTKTGTTFVVTGSGLTKGEFTFPTNLDVTKTRDTYVWFSLKTADLSSVKQVVLKPPRSAPIFILLPAVPKPSDNSNDTGNAKFPLTILESSNGVTTFAITGDRGSRLQDATFLLPAGLSPLRAGDTFLWFKLTADQVSSIREVVIQWIGRAPITLAVPKTPAESDDTMAKATLKADSTGISAGSTSPYKITGTNLQQISSIRYLGKPLPFSRSKDNTSVTLATLPTSLVAVPGIVDLEIQFTDGTTQPFEVTVNATATPSIGLAFLDLCFRA